MKKPHLSPSTINQYLRCSAQTYFKRTVGPKAPGIALLYGKSTDEAVNTDMEQKIDSHKDLGSDDLKDAFTSAWDRDKDSTEFYANDKPEELREIGVKAISVWVDELAPTIQPVSVQEQLKIEFPDFDYDIVQYTDVITDKKTIIDNKTAGRSISTDKRTGSLIVPPEHRIQLTMYGMGYEANYGESPLGLGLDYSIKNKQPKMQRVSWEPNQDDKQLALNLIVRVADGINKEIFIPNRNAFMCNRRMCGWWSECEANFGGKVKL